MEHGGSIRRSHQSMNAKIILGSSAFLFLGFAPISVVAQVTCTPTFGGGQRCTDNNGNSTTSTPTFGGGYRTTDNNGKTTTTTPTFGGGSRSTDNNGNTRTTTPTFGGGYRTTDKNGNSVTCVPTFGGGVRWRVRWIPLVERGPGAHLHG